MERLKAFFDPKSVALVGATDKRNAVGRIILDNLLLAREKRQVYPINPNREEIFELKCYPDISSLPEVPQLVVIAIPAQFVPDVVEKCGQAGVKSIVIISSGFKEIGAEGKALEAKITDIASEYGIRIVGPNCLGVMKPSTELNASFANKLCKPGHIALLSQSGALATAILDWAASRDIGFSAVASLGSMLDVDFGDLIDYLGGDPETQSIIVYLESLGDSLTHTKRFMSAARGFARTKPVMVIKPGKSQESREAAQSHTGAMVGDDLYYDAVFARAGVVRVEEIGDIFNCASALNAARLPHAPNLAIITNAGGPAALATDALIDKGGKLAQLGEKTLAALNEFLPHYWSKSNPIDILGDADPRRYVKTIEAVLKDPGVSGVIIIYTPQGAAKPTQIARTIIKYIGKNDKPILVAMMGGEEVAEAKQIFCGNGIPIFEFPEDAVKTYLYMYKYARNLEMLYETPEDLPLERGAPKNYLKILARKAVMAGQSLLSEEDSKKFLTTYGISATIPYTASNAEEAVRVASRVGYPVAMKISSPDITHKSDVGGVMLNISSDSEVKKAFDEIIGNAKKHQPKARVDGVSLQRMVTKYDCELIIGSKKDLTLGPVIMFGLGGTEAEFFKDVAIGLPPLNQILARRVIEQTKIYKLLSEGFRAVPPVNMLLVDEVLVAVSNLIVDFPEIKELDINPLVISGDVAVALDARIILDEEVVRRGVEEHAHLIISPYPTKYIQPWRVRDGRQVLLRPIRPEDEPLERELIANLSPETSRFRFFHVLKETTHEMLNRFCNIDYDREMAIIAEYTSNGKRRNVGVGRLLIEFGREIGEFAVVVADDFQGNGLGQKLVDMLIDVAQGKGLKSIYGVVLNDNKKMIGLGTKLGFIVERYSPEESKLVLEL
ncbi:MAG: bifunctional acetate--CoA ligase family protein/GNAT family N-acetyltransferase [Dehalococcoidales bacterium]|nr:bifunctional acetate--CoA ligase family protein/GNAT family N-acetyltransferase [Dehalococcoidales bacterium]